MNDNRSCWEAKIDIHLTKSVIVHETYMLIIRWITKSVIVHETYMLIIRWISRYLLWGFEKFVSSPFKPSLFPSPVVLTISRARGVYFSKIWYFCPPSFFNMIFFRKVQWIFFLYARFSTSSPWNSRFFLINHHICEKWKIYTPVSHRPVRLTPRPSLAVLHILRQNPSNDKFLF